MIHVWQSLLTSKIVGSSPEIGLQVFRERIYLPFSERRCELRDFMPKGTRLIETAYDQTTLTLLLAWGSRGFSSSEGGDLSSSRMKDSPFFLGAQLALLVAQVAEDVFLDCVTCTHFADHFQFPMPVSLLFLEAASCIRFPDQPASALRASLDLYELRTSWKPRSTELNDSWPCS
jgi:hypothetical protein